MSSPSFGQLKNFDFDFWKEYEYKRLRHCDDCYKNQEKPCISCSTKPFCLKLCDDCVRYIDDEPYCQYCYEVNK